jgi:hypothetical protein
MSSLRSWSRFNETLLAEIYGQNLIWLDLSLYVAMALNGFKML